MHFDGGDGFDTLALRNGSFADQLSVAYDAHSGKIELEYWTQPSTSWL